MELTSDNCTRSMNLTRRLRPSKIQTYCHSLRLHDGIGATEVSENPRRWDNRRNAKLMNDRLGIYKQLNVITDTLSPCLVAPHVSPLGTSSQRLSLKISPSTHHYPLSGWYSRLASGLVYPAGFMDALVFQRPIFLQISDASRLVRVITCKY